MAARALDAHNLGVMTDGDEAGAASYASGGGGTVLEHRYGTVLLASLLTRAPIPDLGDDAPPVYLRFQGALTPAITRSGHNRWAIIS
jgi:hypothetical protein